MTMNFWVGGYMGTHGAARGISLLRTAGEPGEAGLAGVADSPSWVAHNPRVPMIYAALEHEGRLSSFAIDATGTPERVGTDREAGELVCHIAVSADGRHAIASCYGDGRVVYFPLDDEGIPGKPVIATAAGEPRMTAKDRPSRAHQALFLKGSLVLTTDLGRDLIRVWKVSDGRLELLQELALGLGSGPRHMASHRSGVVFVVTEYSNEILTLAPDENGIWSQLASVPVADAHEAGQDFPAEICLNDAGTVLYVAVRGANRISTFAVVGDPVRLERLSVTGSGGNWPRHHVVSDGRLYVANQLSNGIAVFGLDPETGVPGDLLTTIPAPSPTCLAPVRHRASA